MHIYRYMYFLSNGVDQEIFAQKYPSVIIFVLFYFCCFGTPGV